MHRFGRTTSWSIFQLVGWLFADLLLALMVIFLAASAQGAKPPPPPPAPTPLPCLERKPLDLNLTGIDFNGLQSSDLGTYQVAAAGVEQQVRSNTALKGRRAGLVLTYAGSPTSNPDDSNQAISIAQKVDSVLEQMGKSNFVFVGTVYHDPNLYIGKGFDYVLVQVYLFALPGTCDA